MRVKKYKRVKRPKVHVGLPGPGEDGHDADAEHETTGLPVATRRPEESDSNVEGESEHLQENEGSDIVDSENTKKPRRSSTTAAAAAANNNNNSVNSVARVSDEAIFEGSTPPAANDCVTPSAEQKKGNQSVSDTDTQTVEELAAVATATATALTTGVPADIYDSTTPRDDPAPRTTAGSSAASPTLPGVNLDSSSDDRNNSDGRGGAAWTLTASKEPEEKDDGDDDNADAEHDGGGGDDSSTATNGNTLASRGSIWFKAERVTIFVQLLALALDVDGAGWPPLFVKMWGWTWFTTEYLRWPLLVLVREVGSGLSLSLGSEELGLWFFRDVVGYGVEISAVTVAVFVLFFVLQMPDYTSHKPKERWQRGFLTHWFQLTLSWYLFNLCLCYGVFAALAYYGSVIFPPDVITAVIVVGGTLLTVSWLFVVLLSFLIHLYFRSATKHGAEFSFMIAMVRVSASLSKRHPLSVRKWKDRLGMYSFFTYPTGQPVTTCNDRVIKVTIIQRCGVLEGVR